VAHFHSTLIADTEPFHIEIANNIVYNNRETNIIPGPHSDGNGIIIDDWLDTQEPPYTAYPYQGLVQSNLVTGNGGKGIQVYLSANVTVANNTVFGNNLDVLINGIWRGELNNAASHTISWINNIAWSQPIPGDPVLKYNTSVLMASFADYSQANVTFSSNLTFNGQSGNPSASLPTAALLSAFAAQNKAGVNPLLENLQPKGQSPALASGLPTPNFPPVSLWGTMMRTPPDIGAY
jgi:serralysin